MHSTNHRTAIVLLVPTLDEDGETADWKNTHKVDIVQTGLDLLMIIDENGKANEPACESCGTPTSGR